MKKGKLISLATLFLALSVVGCGTPKPAHNFAEEWTTNATKHWHACTDEGCKERSDEANHTFVEDASQAIAPTHTEPGKKVEFCSVCNYKKETTISALGHTFVDATPDELAAAEKENVAASCTEAGVKWQKCSCGEWQEVELPALGHVYEQVDGVDVVEWTSEATCTEPGIGKKVCTRCQEELLVEVEALGHDLQLVDGDAQTEPGKATVRLYSCSRCDVSYMGFKANEPSAESLPHLVINDDGGARFWGRPIGNALPLTEDGTSVNQQDGEVVYCSTETGDFFEYVFDLTAEQAAMLSTCRLYADAKPADYLNGTDFWAYGSNNSEWTPGYYIDGAEGHYEVDEDGNPVMVKDHDRDGNELETLVKMGKRIADYRYILYVDGEVKAFDPSIKNPTKGSGANMQRQEFVVPFTFNLHEGENRISLRMAGGYRSIFYNFTFRPYVAE